MTGIAVKPRYATVPPSHTLKFIVSGRGDRPVDYRVTLRVEGRTILEKWFEGPDVFSYSKSHTFPNVGVIPVVARLTELPIGPIWEMRGEIKVEEEAPPPPPPDYTLRIAVAGTGTTDPPPGSYVFEEGTRVTVLATPDPGNILDYWLVDSGKRYENPIVVEMTEDLLLQAVFVVGEPPPPPPPPDSPWWGIAAVVGALAVITVVGVVVYHSVK